MPTADPPVIDLQPVKASDGTTIYKIPVSAPAAEGAIFGTVLGALLVASAGYFIPKIFDKFFEGRDNQSQEWDDEYD